MRKTKEIEFGNISANFKTCARRQNTLEHLISWLSGIKPFELFTWFKKSQGQHCSQDLSVYLNAWANSFLYELVAGFYPERWILLGHPTIMTH